jgi:hypothetical protein
MLLSSSSSLDLDQDRIVASAKMCAVGEDISAMRDRPKRARERDNLLHAPFRVTTHRGHTVQMFQSLQLALEAAEALGPDHYVIDRHGLQIWDQQRKLLRDEE